MSAFIVDDATIDVILDTLKAAVSHVPHPCRLYWKGADGQARTFDQNDARDHDKMSELGRMLLAENARSVGERYREGLSPCALLYCYNPTRKEIWLRSRSSLHGQEGRAYDSTRLRAAIVAEAALKNIACFEYQACECEDWEDTESFRFCAALKDRIADIALEGADCDPWGWTDQHLGRAEAVPA